MAILLWTPVILVKTIIKQVQKAKSSYYMGKKIIIAKYFLKSIATG
jgi:hypothetical protein